MAKDLFNRYIWLVDVIYRAGKITFEEINERWKRNAMSRGEDLPVRTFHNHRAAIEELFDINIECDKRGGYRYYIENADDMEQGGVRTWLLNTFAVNNLINESHHLKRRILFEEIPSGQVHLTPVIEAMRDGLTLEITYQSYWRDEPHTFEVEPYCVKVFRQRWYLVGRSPYYDSVRIYALDRIHKLYTTDTPFSYPKAFDPQAYFHDYFGIIADGEMAVETVRLRVRHNQQPYFRALPLHHSQCEVETADDYAVFEYRLRPTYDFQQELLSRGSDVEVLAPAWLRHEIGGKLEQAAAMYR